MRIRIALIAIISLYAISILPSLHLSLKQQGDLGEVIQLVQQLSQTSSAEHTEFLPTFQASLSALHLAAGMSVIIVETPLNEYDQSPAGLIIDVKSPLLLSGCLSIHCKAGKAEICLRDSWQYRSITLPPPTPPPLCV